MTAPSVFMGTVISTEYNGRLAVVNVDELWKGPPLPAMVEVQGSPALAAGEASSVDRYFDVGQHYLFVPNSAAPPFEDDGCTATQVYTPALAAYRPGAAVPTLTASVTQTDALSPCDADITHRQGLPTDPSQSFQLPFLVGSERVVVRGMGFPPGEDLNLDGAWSAAGYSGVQQPGTALGLTAADDAGAFACSVMLDLTPPAEADQRPILYVAAYPSTLLGPAPDALAAGAQGSLPLAAAMRIADLGTAGTRSQQKAVPRDLLFTLISTAIVCCCLAVQIGRRSIREGP
ncbi:MAG: hypothetical protein ACYDCQ_15965 [Dehalococcoidia bacterium]